MNTIQTLVSNGLDKSTRRQVMTAVSITCLVGFFFAQSNSAMAREEHGAHSHGIATLNLIVENNMLELELESPAVNLLGFEHAPQNETQREALERARAILSSPGDVLVLPEAGCSSTSTLVKVEGPAGEAADSDHSEDKHHEGDHDKDERHEDKHADHSSGESHSEFMVSYGFDCESASKLNSVDVKLFEHFKGLEKINVNWVTDSGQGSILLEANSTEIRLR